MSTNDDFWNWAESRQTPQDKQKKLCKEITKYHFGEIIDWNIQTSMYELLTYVVGSIDLKYLSAIATMYKSNGNINDISAQLEDAILDVLIQKRLIKNKIPKPKKNKLII